MIIWGCGENQNRGSKRTFRTQSEVHYQEKFRNVWSDVGSGLKLGSSSSGKTECDLWPLRCLLLLKKWIFSLALCISALLTTGAVAIWSPECRWADIGPIRVVSRTSGPGQNKRPILSVSVLPQEKVSALTAENEDLSEKLRAEEERRQRILSDKSLVNATAQTEPGTGSAPHI